MPCVNLPELIKIKLTSPHICLQRASNHQKKAQPQPERASLCRKIFFFQRGINGLVGFDWLSLSFSRTSHNSIGFKINSHCREKSSMRAAITVRCHRAHYWARCCSEPHRKNTKQLWPFLVSAFLFSFVLTRGNFETAGTHSGGVNQIYINSVVTQMSGPCQPPVASGDTIP